jgi:hypothetical protein
MTIEAALRVGVIALVAVVLRWLAARAITRGVAGMRRREIGSKRVDARASAVASVFSNLTTWTVVIIAVLLALGEVDVQLAPLLAGAGVAGVAIGFGAQSLVRDVLAGIFVLIEDQYGVGDIIDAGPATGTVERVTLRSTQLRDLAGTVWHIPNGTITRVGNKSQNWGARRGRGGAVPRRGRARCEGRAPPRRRRDGGRGAVGRSDAYRRRGRRAGHFGVDSRRRDPATGGRHRAEVAVAGRARTPLAHQRSVRCGGHSVRGPPPVTAGRLSSSVTMDKRVGIIGMIGLAVFVFVIWRDPTGAGDIFTSFLKSIWGFLGDVWDRLSQFISSIG